MEATLVKLGLLGVFCGALLLLREAAPAPDAPTRSRTEKRGSVARGLGLGYALLAGGLLVQIFGTCSP